MADLPLHPLCLSVKFSPFPFSNCKLSAVGFELPVPLGPLPDTLARPLTHKSLVCNGYRIHGGVGGCVPFFSPHSPCVDSATRRNARNSTPPICLLHNSWTHGVGVYALSPVKFLHSPLGTPPHPDGRPNPAVSIRLSTLNFRVHPPVSSHHSPVTKRGSRNTGHGSRSYEPAHL
jgi:hypothetical protein